MKKTYKCITCNKEVEGLKNVKRLTDRNRQWIYRCLDCQAFITDTIAMIEGFEVKDEKMASDLALE